MVLKAMLTLRRLHRLPVLRNASSRRSIINLHHQTLALPDGRTLGYAEYGDSEGKPLIWLHGYPTSRFEARDLDPIAKKRNIRLVAPDRPGAGLSTLRPRSTSASSFPPRRIIDFPPDLLTLVDHLQLPKLSILGCSGGGPFALACAHLLPRDRLHSVGLVSSAGPWRVESDSTGNDQHQLLMKDVTWQRKVLYLAVTKAPHSTIKLSGWTLGLLQAGLKTQWAEEWIDNWLDNVRKAAGADSSEATLSEDDRKVIRDRLIESFMEGFAQGTEGFVHDARLLTDPWGFRFEDIDFDAIKVWHGAKDIGAPVDQIRYMATRLPYCEYVEYPDLDHFGLGLNIEEILDDMMRGQPETQGCEQEVHTPR